MYGLAFINSRPEVARKFMRAYILGSRYYNDAIAGGEMKGPTAADVIAILVRYSLVKDAEVHRRSMPPAIAADGRLNVSSLRKDWQFFKDTGQIDGKVTVDDVVDTSFVEAALVSLPPHRPAAEPR
jgi:NitT/TauT family transport system substrate-binding protein